MPFGTFLKSLLRHNPAWIKEGKSAFVLASREPSGDYQAFLNGEVRYNALVRQDPERAKELFDQSEREAGERYAYLKKLHTLYGAEPEKDYKALFQNIQSMMAAFDSGEASVPEGEAHY